MDPTWFLMHFVRMTVIDYLARIDPWTVERLDEETEKVEQSLRTITVPDREWSSGKSRLSRRPHR
jgi:hypothetical protein